MTFTSESLCVCMCMLGGGGGGLRLDSRIVIALYSHMGGHLVNNGASLLKKLPLMNYSDF